MPSDTTPNTAAAPSDTTQTTQTITTAPSDPAPPTRSDDETKRLAKEMMLAWDKQVASMRNASQSIDWSGADWSNLKAKDIGVTFGPPMTEEQFREYRKNKAVQVLKKK